MTRREKIKKTSARFRICHELAHYILGHKPIDINKALKSFGGYRNYLKNEYEVAKTEYVDQFFPQITKLLDSIKIIEKIMPEIDFYAESFEKIPFKQVFLQNTKYLSKRELKSRKIEFEKSIRKMKSLDLYQN